MRFVTVKVGDLSRGGSVASSRNETGSRSLARTCSPVTQGGSIVAQGVLPFQYCSARGDTGYTALAGLPAFLDLAQVLGLAEGADRHIAARAGGQGFSDGQMVMAGVLLNLAGGDCVDDLAGLEADEGFARLLRRVELRHLPRYERRQHERRWRRKRERSVPSPSSMRRYLGLFHGPEEESKRTEAKAFIPAAKECLRGFRKVNAGLLARFQACRTDPVATLDLDATLVETHKRAALFSYEGYKAYQPLNVWWSEKAVVLHTEFRDGNVPASYDNQRVFAEALDLLPVGVTKVRLRSDAAAYQHGLLRFCDRGEHPRFGRIEFAVSAPVQPDLKAVIEAIPEEGWSPIHAYAPDGRSRRETGRQWAEVAYASNGMGRSKHKDCYRYVVTRELKEEQELPGMPQRELPFPAYNRGTKLYGLRVIATNLDVEGWDGEDVVLFADERCGKAEEAHAVMKRDLAGGTLPSQDFGANAAWWWMMVLALNLTAAMKALALGQDWLGRRMKAIRFHLIHLAGRVVETARRLVVKVSKKVTGWLVGIRMRIAELGTG